MRSKYFISKIFHSFRKERISLKKTKSYDLVFFWWERVDSNHRSRRQQIYSLPPLATRELSHIHFTVKRGWSWWTDSNPRPADYKSAALPTELHQHLDARIIYHKKTRQSSPKLKKSENILLFSGEQLHDNRSGIFCGDACELGKVHVRAAVGVVGDCPHNAERH